MASHLYQTNGRVKEVSPANGVNWTRDELCAIVGGQPEVLTTIDGHFMVTNDLSKLMGMEENRPATLIYAHKDSDFIAGPALVVETKAEMYGQ